MLDRDRAANRGPDPVLPLEDGHHPVADELVDLPAVALDELGLPLEGAIHPLENGARLRALVLEGGVRFQLGDEHGDCPAPAGDDGNGVGLLNHLCGRARDEFLHDLLLAKLSQERAEALRERADLVAGVDLDVASVVALVNTIGDGHELLERPDHATREQVAREDGEPDTEHTDEQHVALKRAKRCELAISRAQGREQTDRLVVDGRQWGEDRLILLPSERQPDVLLRGRHRGSLDPLPERARRFGERRARLAIGLVLGRGKENDLAARDALDVKGELVANLVAGDDGSEQLGPDEQGNRNGVVKVAVFAPDTAGTLTSECITDERGRREIPPALGRNVRASDDSPLVVGHDHEIASDLLGHVEGGIECRRRVHLRDRRFEVRAFDEDRVDERELLETVGLEIFVELTGTGQSPAERLVGEPGRALIREQEECAGETDDE